MTANKNLYEELIDQMMINSFPEEFKERISYMSIKDKRMAILSLLDKDRNLFMKIKSIIGNTRVSKVDHLKEVILMLREYVKVGEVEKKKFGEVMSSLDKVVKPMLKDLEENVEGVWNNPNLKFLDCSNGVGPFPIMVIWKLMSGLSEWQPDQELRYKHIVENMIYVCELQPKNMFLYMCALDPNDEYDLNVYTGSFLDKEFDEHMKNVWRVDKFSVCLSNPPYQQMDGGHGSSAKPIYNLFTEKAIKISDKVLFITPSRWFGGGKGLDKFRKMMMESNKIRLINHFDDASKLFENVEIKGGVSYFIWDNKYNGNCKFHGFDVDLSEMDVVISDPKYISLISKIKSSSNLFLNSLCRGRGDNVFGIQSNDVRLMDSKKEGYILCHVSIKKGRYKYINPNVLKNKTKLSSHKVITTEAATKGGEGFGNIYAINPNESLNGSYIFFETESSSESESLLSYLKTKFANKMLSLRKVSHHIKPDTCKWIPIVPFDREWTDGKLFEHFNLQNDEIDLIMDQNSKDEIDSILNDIKDKNILDIGSGLDRKRGNIPLSISLSENNNVTCIDREICNEYKELIKEKNIKYVQLDLEKDSILEKIPKNKFDLVIFQNVSHLIKNTDQILESILNINPVNLLLQFKFKERNEPCFHGKSTIINFVSKFEKTYLIQNDHIYYHNSGNGIENYRKIFLKSK